MFCGGDRRTWGVEFDERSTETTDGEGEWDVVELLAGGRVVTGGGDGCLTSKGCCCRRLSKKLL